MSNPCQFNVYLRIKGEKKKEMLASFAGRTDAVNFAFEKSNGQFSSPNFTLLALDLDRTIFQKFIQGVRV
jgi:hypothetical protein